MILSYKPLGETSKRLTVATVRANHPFPTQIVLQRVGLVIDRSTWQDFGCEIVRAEKTERQALSRMGLI